MNTVDKNVKGTILPVKVVLILRPEGRTRIGVSENKDIMGTFPSKTHQVYENTLFI
jgi:hypothetical protein